MQKQKKVKKDFVDMSAGQSPWSGAPTDTPEKADEISEKK